MSPRKRPATSVRALTNAKDPSLNEVTLALPDHRGKRFIYLTRQDAAVLAQQITAHLADTEPKAGTQ